MPLYSGDDGNQTSMLHILKLLLCPQEVLHVPFHQERYKNPCLGQRVTRTETYRLYCGGDGNHSDILLTIQIHQQTYTLTEFSYTVSQKFMDVVGDLNDSTLTSPDELMRV